MSKGGNYIGGSVGSGSINSSSVGLSRAAGGAVGGYAMPKSSVGPAANTKGANSPEPRRPIPPAKARDEASSIKAGGGKNSQMSKRM
jgi:hypothetical protein